jgi:Mono-functional DNA-alkylating methyl methanesulfonate N-term
MDFLPPPARVKNQVMLLLLVAQRNGTYMHLYSWDTRLGLGNAKPSRCSGQRLPSEDSHPLMLIPSTKWTSFIIVTETEIVVYDDILSPHAKRINLPLTDQYPPRYENSTRTPLWVQWTKPSRHAGYNKTHDDICLVREDGQMRYYIIDRTTPTKIDAHFRPGNLGINVDTAFASMAGPAALGGGDSFIVGGDLTDGGVFQCVAKNSPICTQILPNISPVHDMLTINSHDHNGSKALRDPDRQERIFVCSGRGTGHTAVSEIRYGLEAQIGFTADYNDLSSVSQVWTLPDTENGRLVFLISHAQYSTAMSLYLADLELEVADSESCRGIDLTTPTIAAAMLPGGLIVQITQAAVNVTAFSPNAPAISNSYPSRIVAAVIISKLRMLAMGFEGSTGFEIRLFRVSSNDSTIKVEQLGEAIETSQAPTALSSAENGPTQLLLVGTVSGLLLIISLEEVAGLKLVAEHSLTSLLKCPEPCTITSLAILKGAGGVERGILCGLRTGSLVCLTMKMNAKPAMNPGKLPEERHNQVQPMIDTRYLTFKYASTGFDSRASSWPHIRKCGSGYHRRKCGTRLLC